ncbi:SprT-like protein [Trichococcus patagoniensis]|uniref:Protein SprT-like n=1 Tax=Trichococcus patagoniensis TaxID=382641 RepID=A0A2T5IMX9_9LACT|nr:SprT family protein [Trichococcus patagoniensis]PTQ85182.1 SprT-like protein [Trichococcus patagoniensis]
MNEQELQQLVEHISITIFRKPFRHRASFNRRLRTTGGRYHLNSHNLDFNPLVLEVHGLEELEKVVKHELCHYHLHLEGRGYRHRDADFRNLLKASGGSRFVKDLRPAPAEEIAAAPKWLYSCSACGQNYPRKRRIDVKKYVCGKCKGKLQMKV